MISIEGPAAVDEVSEFPSRISHRLTGRKTVGECCEALTLDPVTGTEPDPRFTLANERTLLAWNRTSLALIGGGLAANQLIDFSSTAARLMASVTPVVLGAALAIVSLRRWLTIQRALRAGAPLPTAQTAVVLVVGIGVLGAAIMLSIVLDAIAG
ncbi:MAG: DUF202 domain-containing protein [Proteobacteria bacterium]|nr:DUF202 domain-containing protein [Pseudomonadota bacterium]